MLTPQRREQLEKLLAEQYELLTNLERRILYEKDLQVEGNLRLQVEDVRRKIAAAEQELSGNPPPITPIPEIIPQLVTTPTFTLPELRQKLVEKYSLEDLRDLCFDLKVDYESLPGEGKAAKARELIAYMQRRDRLPELISIITKGE
jgi:hypothetical protein